MLYAAFSTLMNFSEIEQIPNASGFGRYGQEIEDCGIQRVRGWRFDYFKIDGAWNSESYPDIVEDPHDSVFALLVDIPPRVFNSICEQNNIYSGHYKFDYLNVDSLGREAVVIRLSHPSEAGKPDVRTVAKLVENALSSKIDKRYIEDVIIARAGFSRRDIEFFYKEENYSPLSGPAYPFIREYYDKQKPPTK
jgi:hypothetical protein